MSPDEVYALVSALARRRREQDLSVARAAELCGSRATFITALEAGVIDPPLRFLLEYARALGMDLKMKLEPRP